MSEAKLRARTLKLLKPRHGVSVENVISAGTPDINYVEGWMELKYLPAWPKTASAKVPFKCRKPQNAWMKHRAALGGACWWWLQVGNVYILIHAKNLRGSPPINELNRSELMRKASVFWHGIPSQDQFLKVLDTHGLSDTHSVTD